MCDDCAPAGGWDRRRFLAAAGALALAPAVGVAGPTAAQATTPAIFPRRAWGGDLPPAGPLAPEPDVRFLLVHHTVNANDYSPDDVVGLLRAMYRFHTGAEKSWPDIAYNFVVDRFGRIWEARAGSAVRARWPVTPRVAARASTRSAPSSATTGPRRPPPRPSTP